MVGVTSEPGEHATTVNRIAAERFPFPTADQTQWVTIRAGTTELPGGAPAPDIAAATADLAVDQRTSW